jgi:hypothetical protein
LSLTGLLTSSETVRRICGCHVVSCDRLQIAINPASSPD